MRRTGRQIKSSRHEGARRSRGIVEPPIAYSLGSRDVPMRGRSDASSIARASPQTMSSTCEGRSRRYRQANAKGTLRSRVTGPDPRAGTAVEVLLVVRLLHSHESSLSSNIDGRYENAIVVSAEGSSSDACGDSHPQRSWARHRP